MDNTTIDFIEICLKIGIGLLLMFFGVIGYRNSRLLISALFGAEQKLYRQPRREAPFWEKYK